MIRATRKPVPPTRVSMMVHVLSVVFSSIPTRDFTSQKPESLKWEQTVGKDKDSSIVAHRVADQIYGPRRIGSVIEPQKTNSYKFNLNNKSPKVKWVETHFNIETRTLNKQNKVERWKKEITKVYEY